MSGGYINGHPYLTIPSKRNAQTSWRMDPAEACAKGGLCEVYPEMICPWVSLYSSSWKKSVRRTG